MQTPDNESGWVSGKKTVTEVNIKGLDKAVLLSRLYSAAAGPNWYEEFDEIEEIRRNGFGHFYCIDDVLFNADFSGDTVNSFYYNEAAGKGDLFERVVYKLLHEK